MEILKDKIVGYFKKDPVSKVLMFGILIATAVLFWGWISFFAEVRAFEEYKNDHIKNVNCFPLRELRDEGV